MKKQPAIYTFEVQLVGAKIPVWRIIEVKKNITMQELAATILVAMGWEGSHHFEFIIGDVILSCFEDKDAKEFQLPTKKYALAENIYFDQLELTIGDSFDFIYDFGDYWNHTVTLKAFHTVAPNEFYGYPMCSSGGMACPPEDIGGIPVYNQLVEFCLHKIPITIYPDLQKHYKSYDIYTVKGIRYMSFAFFTKQMLDQYK